MVKDKPWCVYGYFLGPWGFGKIVEDRGDIVHIKYCEGQLYPPESWNSKWIKRFPTLEEAVNYYIENRLRGILGEGETEEEIRARAKRYFPSQFKIQ
jgi:hypothetical protein